MQCRLVCGRSDGSIVTVPATQTIMLQLMSGKHQKYPNWPQHQVLIGHEGKNLIAPQLEYKAISFLFKIRPCKLFVVP